MISSSKLSTHKQPSSALQAVSQSKISPGRKSASPKPQQHKRDGLVMSDNHNDAETTGSSDSQSDVSEPTRPNRWAGAPSTWASLTAQERGLAASLDQIRNADLSVHLYNAYLLKKRARDASSPREVRSKSVFALQQVLTSGNRVRLNSRRNSQLFRKKIARSRRRNTGLRGRYHRRTCRGKARRLGLWIRMMNTRLG